MSMFALPRRPFQVTRITDDQWRALTKIEFLDGEPLAGSEVQVTTFMLRLLLRRKLIEVVALSPARYRLTQLGRSLRSSHAHQRREARHPD